MGKMGLYFPFGQVRVAIFPRQPRPNSLQPAYCLSHSLFLESFFPAMSFGASHL
jgi:hypothetical protein